MKSISNLLQKRALAARKALPASQQRHFAGGGKVVRMGADVTDFDLVCVGKIYSLIFDA
jgi:hypothetical protein